MPKLYDMEGVRGGEEEFPVELHVDNKSGRLVVRGFNEGGFGCVDIDLIDLCGWLGLDEGAIRSAVAARQHPR